jgi:hypothetical protein
MRIRNVAVAVGVVVGAFVLAACVSWRVSAQDIPGWTPPPKSPPPEGNTPAPVNVGSSGQGKIGGLNIGMSGAPPAGVLLNVTGTSAAQRIIITAPSGATEPILVVDGSNTAGSFAARTVGNAITYGFAVVSGPNAGVVISNRENSNESWQWYGTSYGSAPGLRLWHASSTGGTGGTDLLAITGTGNVGVGTIAPTKKLEVVGGPIKATGGLIVETATADPTSPETARIWLRTDLPVTAAPSGGTGGGVSGVTSVTGGTGIGVSPTTGNVVVSNTGVTKIIAGSGVSISPSSGTGNVTITATAPAATAQPVSGGLYGYCRSGNGRDPTHNVNWCQQQLPLAPAICATDVTCGCKAGYTMVVVYYGAMKGVSYNIHSCYKN